jgi:hypothetical protein
VPEETDTKDNRASIPGNYCLHARPRFCKVSAKTEIEEAKGKP